MSHIIKKVKHLKDYKLIVQFDDGSMKEVDLIDTINRAKGSLLLLRDVEYFKKVKCDGITIVWPNGVDLCPDNLYKIGKSITKPKKKQLKTAIKTKKKQRKTSSVSARRKKPKLKSSKLESK